MKYKYTVIFVLIITFSFVITYYNWKYEVIAINPFYGDDKHDLKVLTWNVHCSDGADYIRQEKIARLIIQEDPDFLLLNEYNQDSCIVIDSLLKIKYPYTEEYQSHRWCGDIFYSKRAMTNSGHVYIPVEGKTIQTIKATIPVGEDSVQVFGIHMASNQYDGCEVVSDSVAKRDFNSAYKRYKDAQILRCFQAEWTNNEILKSKHPVIVMGDMNDFNCSEPLKILQSCELQDSWWEGGNGYGHTFHSGWLQLRIDHILHSNDLELQNVKIIESKLSDHNPVIASFRLN